MVSMSMQRRATSTVALVWDKARETLMPATQSRRLSPRDASPITFRFRKVRMDTGAQLLALAQTRLGEKYVNVQVPKDNAHWHGPWDCAEFASWLAFQATGRLYGCISNTANPALADAYSGAWVRDTLDGRLDRTTQLESNSIAGAVLIRTPPAPGKMGHIA